MEEPRSGKPKSSSKSQQSQSQPQFPTEELLEGGFKMKNLINSIFKHSVDKFFIQYPKLLAENSSSSAIVVNDQPPTSIPDFILRDLQSTETTHSRWEKFKVAFCQRLDAETKQHTDPSDSFRHGIEENQDNEQGQRTPAPANSSAKKYKKAHGSVAGAGSHDLNQDMSDADRLSLVSNPQTSPFPSPFVR